jgi:signal transduction histidine kinase
VAAIGEALTNARRHSGADRARVAVTVGQDGLAVLIEDHGRGFDPTAVSPGFGLANSILGPLEQAGGRAELRSAPGAGTQVRLWLPT